MAYGTVKVDTVTFTYASVDTSTTFSGLHASTTNNLTLSGTASANTFTGTTANFTNTNAQNISVTTLLSGLAITGGTAGFTTVTGTTVTGTTANFVTISGTSITGGTAGFTTVTGTTVTGTTANFVTVSGTTVTGNIGQFTSLTGATTTMTSGVFASGTEPLPSISFVSDPNTGIYSPGADQLAVATNGTEKLIVLSNGNVGIGTSSPSVRLQVQDSIAGGSDNTIATLHNFSDTGGDTRYAGLNFRIGSDNGTSAIRAFRTNTATNYETNLSFWTNPTGATQTPLRAMTIDSSQRVGIGTTGPNAALDVRSATAWVGDGTTDAFLQFNQSATAANRWHIGAGTDNALLFYKGTYGTGSEKARIDSSGRLLVGTSSVTAVTDGNINPRFEVEGTDGSTGAIAIIRNSADANGAGLVIAKSRGAVAGSNTSVISADTIGEIRFEGADGTQKRIAASIGAAVDGTPGAADMPGRLVFSTTADGASSPAERMRITNSGQIWFNKTSNSFGATGIQFRPGTSDSWFTTDATNVVALNRLTNDGTLLEFAQDSVVEGSVSVSGTTVSYNGAHLSRWSQLPSGAERTEILRGTVLSNIDEMCEWGDEDNEQLNRMKVSDVEGDKNVSGVFQAWDDDDDTYTNDFYCAMTGDFIIRIAAGTTVERGDLLMSAGDGTAKPQDDDIIRSKTIAKVTSTNVSCTYDDGSYCVPCVLMAC